MLVQVLEDDSLDCFSITIPKIITLGRNQNMEKIDRCACVTVNIGALFCVLFLSNLEEFCTKFSLLDKEVKT